MEIGRAADPAGEARRAQTLGRCPRSAERHLLRAVDRLPMDSPAEGSAAEEHGLRLSRPVVLGRYAGASAPRTLRRGARAGGSRGQSDRGDHRQPERQSGAKRGISIDPQVLAAGKEVTGRSEGHTSDIQSIISTSYAVFCSKT